MTRFRRVVVAAALAAGVGALATGCGGSSSKQATSTEAAANASSPAAWTDGVCRSLVTWRSRLASERKQLTGGPISKDALRKAADGVASANDKLTSDLEALGEPPGTAGKHAKSAAQDLADFLKAQKKSIEQATAGVSGASDVLRAVSEISGSLSTTAGRLTAAWTEVEAAARAGGSEWKQAFNDSSACRELSKS
jgi:hypothetical protein